GLLREDATGTRNAAAPRDGARRDPYSRIRAVERSGGMGQPGSEAPADRSGDRRAVRGTPLAQRGEGAVGPVPLSDERGGQVALPGQPVLDDRARCLGRRTGSVDGGELVIEVEQAVSERSARVREAHPPLLAGEGEVLDVEVRRVWGAGVDDVLGMLERGDAVGGVQADADERRVDRLDDLDQRRGGNLLVGLQREGDAGALEQGEHGSQLVDRGFRAGKHLLALHYRAQCPGSERLSEVDVPREVVAADAPSAELECDTQ